MSELDTVIQTLERYISPLNARSLVQRATRDRPTSVRSAKALDGARDRSAKVHSAISRRARAEPRFARSRQNSASATAATRVEPCRLTIATEERHHHGPHGSAAHLRRNERKELRNAEGDDGRERACAQHHQLHLGRDEWKSYRSTPPTHRDQLPSTTAPAFHTWPKYSLAITKVGPASVEG